MAAKNLDRVRLSMIYNKREGTETSPEGAIVRVEPNPNDKQQKVGVVYYLSRNGQLEHPHFMEISLSSPPGLYLRDVTNTLNLLRGQGMATLYSWSSKRRYKNGFVWEDLSENDFIHPCRDDEYVLKGSLLIEIPQSFRSYQTLSSLFYKASSEKDSFSCEDSKSQITTRRKNHPPTTFDGVEHKVYRVNTTAGFAAEVVSESTLTDAKYNGMVEVKGKDVEDY